MVVDDVESVKAEAASRLQAALVSGDAVRDAVRWAFYRNPTFMFALFPAALGRRFGSGPDVGEVTAFVSRAAPAGDGDAAAVFPTREAELLIRMSLGQTLLAMGRPHDALSDLSKATELDPTLTDDLRPYLTDCQSFGPQSDQIRPS